MSTYKTTASREGDWWVIDVEGVGVTQAKRLDQIEHMARDMITLLKEESDAEIELDVEVHVDPDLDLMRDESERLVREGEAMIARGRAEKVRVMRELQARKLSARDIGRLVGVSHQRVSQVIGEGVRAYGAVKDAAKGGGVTAAAKAAKEEVLVAANTAKEAVEGALADRGVYVVKTHRTRDEAIAAARVKAEKGPRDVTDDPPRKGRRAKADA